RWDELLNYYSSPPTVDHSKVQPKSIYISEKDGYIVRDPKGVIRSGTLDGIATSYLLWKMDDESFKNFVLKITSKRHHTLPLNVWVYQKEITVNNDKKYY